MMRPITTMTLMSAAMITVISTGPSIGFLPVGRGNAANLLHF
jgi:hypothetical protein